MSDEIKYQVHKINGLYATGIKKIAQWSNLLPGMQQTKESLEWMDASLNQSPPGIFNFPDATLLDYLQKASLEAEVFASIPEPTPNLFPMINSTGSTVSVAFTYYVRRVETEFYDQPEIVQWVGTTIAKGDELRAKQNRSEMAHHRLTLLRPELGELHKEAVNLALKAQAEKDTKPIGAAMSLNRLLDQFKGVLIDKCRGGRGSTYDRLSEYLAANSPLTKTAVLKGQSQYDDLSKELMEIRKSMRTSSGDRIVKILHEIEDHIIVITDALDPSKLGISFS